MTSKSGHIPASAPAAPSVTGQFQSLDAVARVLSRRPPGEWLASAERKLGVGGRRADANTSALTSAHNSLNSPTSPPLFGGAAATDANPGHRVAPRSTQQSWERAPMVMAEALNKFREVFAAKTHRVRMLGAVYITAD